MTVQWNGAAVIAKVRQAALQSVVRATEAVVEASVELIVDGPKSGEVYEWIGTTRDDPRRAFLIRAPAGHRFWARMRPTPHQSSGPGEAPATDSGRLVQSGHTEYNAQTLTGAAVWSTRYADWLEHGTKYMEPRPFAQPALANKKNEIIKDFAADIAAALK